MDVYDGILICGTMDDGRRACFLASTSIVDPNTKGVVARAYLEEENGSGKSIRVFGIGCPANWVSTFNSIDQLLTDKREALGAETGQKEYVLPKPASPSSTCDSNGSMPRPV